jgi:hypothetical protein
MNDGVDVLGPSDAINVGIVLAQIDRDETSGRRWSRIWDRVKEQQSEGTSLMKQAAFPFDRHVVAALHDRT